MYKLLIVDDEPLVCVGVQSILDWKSLDIEIIGTARNGRQAAELIAQHMPDIVISDIKMPVKNGLNLAQECREAYGPLPVFIMLTSYEDFGYARQAIKAHVVDYLVKIELDEKTLGRSIHNALEIVRRYKTDPPASMALARSNMQALREKFFIRLLNNLFDREEIYEAQRADLGIDLTGEDFMAASCEITPPSKLSDTGNDQISFYANIIRLVRETLAKYARCYVVPLDMWHFAVVFCLTEAADEDKVLVQEALTQTTSILRSYVSVSLRSSLGNIVDKPRELHISYRLSRRCVHEATDADPVICCGKSGHTAGTEHIAEMQEIRLKIRKAFEEMDTVSLHEALTLIADTFVNRPGDPLTALDTASNILYMAISLLPEGESLLEQIFADDPEGYRGLYHLRDTDSIAAWIRRLRDGCGELLQTRRQSYKEHVVANVKAYIQENLNKRLSLQEVAAVFNFSPNYLSQLFSKYAKEGFVEYITSSRISAAKEMLSGGELRIYEIAERLGFGSSFYFSKVFKKVEGISPSEYIQKLET